MNIETVKLKKPIKVYCPIMNATLVINSKLLEQMSEFTQFILYSIGKGSLPKDIVKTVDLGTYIVEEEINYLIKIGLIYLENERYYLSEKGKEYYDVIKIIENIGEEDLKVQINCFNGQIISPIKEVKLNKDIEENIQKLKVKVVKELYQNRDFANSREYIFQKLGEVFEENENINLDNIYITIDYERGDLNIPIYINDVNSIKNIQNISNYHESKSKCNSEEITLEEDSEKNIQLKREILQIEVEVTYEELEKYKNTLTTLQNLLLFDQELLSDKSKYLLDLWERQKNIKKIIYFDTVTNEILPIKPDANYNQELYTITIDKQYTINDIDLYSLEQILMKEEWYREDILVDFKVENTSFYYEDRVL